MQDVIRAGCLLLIMLSLCMMQVPVSADDSNMEGVGGAVHMLRGHSTVRMISEEVRIKLPDAQVLARFVFKNDGPATTVTMGFPESGGGVDHDQPVRYTDFDAFESSLDGRPVKVTRVVAGSNDIVGDAEYTIWWTKRVHFARGQTRVVFERYRGGGGGDSMGDEWFTYVLTTGASWKGPIGRARIICDLRGLRHFWPVGVLLPGYRRHGDILVWDFHNIEPKKNVEIHWIPGYGNVIVNGKPLIPKDALSAPGLQFVGNYGMSDLSGMARMEGNDVRMELRTAADWLGGTAKYIPKEHAALLKRGSRWVKVTIGSDRLETASSKPHNLSRPARLLGHGYHNYNQFIMVNLRSIVEALGGTSKFNARRRQTVVTLPPH